MEKQLKHDEDSKNTKQQTIIRFNVLVIYCKEKGILFEENQTRFYIGFMQKRENAMERCTVSAP